MDKYSKINFFEIFENVSKKNLYNFEKNIRKFRELFRKIWGNNYQK